MDVYSLAHVADARASRVPSWWRRSATRLLVSVVAVLVVVALAVGARWAWQDGQLNGVICGGDCGPDYVVAPDGLAVSAPALAATSPPSTVTPIDSDAVVSAVDVLLSDSLLGPSVGFAAAAPDPGAPISTAGQTGVFTPASTTKLLTGYAALATIDPQTRFTTSVVMAGDGVVLIGGGDPYLTARRDKNSSRVERADLESLAEKTAAALQDAGRASVRLGFDDALFTGPSISPGWEDSYIPNNIVTPVSALWVDQGLKDGVRAQDPAQAAANRFAQLVRDAGVDVTGTVGRTAAPAGAAPLASVRSATVEQIVGALIRTSNNQTAEVMLRHVAIAGDRPGSFEEGASAVSAALEAADIDTTGLVLMDGSGLSRRNRISPTTLVDVVQASLSTPRGAAVVDDLPLSGFSGTLADRFDRAAHGLIRAKTGTLSGVHSLAGYALDADGRPVVFAVMSDDADPVKSLAAQASIDDIAAAIAACSCG